MTTTTSNLDSGPHRSAIWRSRKAVALAAALALVIVVWLLSELFGGGATARDGLTFTAQRGPMTVHVTESGTIQAREQVVIKSEVQGQTTIIWLIEEGKHVKAGDLLVELDASKLQDNLVDQQIRVQNTDASFVRARESLEITRSKGESDVAKAELDYEFAIEDLKKYVDGEYPKLLDELKAKIKLAESDLKDAGKTFEWSQKLYKAKYIAESELDRDELRRDRAELDLNTAKANLKLLEEFTYKRRVRELESDVDQTQMALDRVKRQALANVVQYKADLQAKQSELKRQKEKRAKNEDQISKTRISAPAAGMVIYATTGQDNRWNNEGPLEAGRMVRERAELIHLPTANAVLVNIKIHESSLKKISVGQPVRITINALPGKEYFGEVSRIAPLPDAQSFWLGNPDLKVYNTEIYLDGELEGVRTGMTCKAQIIIQQLEDVLSVPVQSVIRIAGQPTVYVRTSRSDKPVPVELGLDNKDRIHIVSGLREGDRVLTNPPLSKTTGGALTDSNQTKPPGPPSPASTPPKAQPVADQAAQPDPTKPEHKPGEGDLADREGRRPSPEQMAKMREQMKNMTPEQRKAFRKKMSDQRNTHGSRPDASTGDAQK